MSGGGKRVEEWEALRMEEGGRSGIVDADVGKMKYCSTWAELLLFAIFFVNVNIVLVNTSSVKFLQSGERIVLSTQLWSTPLFTVQ